MNAIDDDPSREAPKLDSDLTTYFEYLWRHLDARDKRAANDDCVGRKVHLQCAGEVVDADSISVVMRDAEIQSDRSK